MTKKIKKDVDDEIAKWESALAEPGWKNTLTKAKKKSHEEAAKTRLSKESKKDARVNIRIAEEDLFRLKFLADKEGLGYQTLMSSVLHKYASGSYILIDKDLYFRTPMHQKSS